MCTQLQPVAVATRPLEVADIFRQHGKTFRQHHRLSGQQLRVMRAIETCRTAAQGGHLLVCDTCGAVTLKFHSCRNRHCPKCQTLDKERWLQARQADLLETGYFHCVFTLPHALNPLAQGNHRVLYNLLMRAAAQTLQAFGRNPRWLGGEIGITMVLHTWGQNLGQHIHVHCIVPGGALAPDAQHWIPAKKGFLFPTSALSRVFRGKYLNYLEQAYQRGELHFAGSVQVLQEPAVFKRFLHTLTDRDWVVYAKPPFAGPKQVLAYLGRYTHRVALSNERLVNLENGQVRFRWKDYAHGNKPKVMTLDAAEFIRRFLLHVIPSGFMRIRHFGVLANRCRKQKLAACRHLLGQCPPKAPTPETTEEFLLRLTGIDIQQCPHCQQGRIRVIATLQVNRSAVQLPGPSPP